MNPYCRKNNLANPNPARIPPQTPPAGGKSAEAKRKILSPRKTDFRFAESALKPHALPEYLEGRTPKKNVLSIFKKNFTPAKSKKQETFFFGVAGVLASAWGFPRIICFENRFELGTINTPEFTPRRAIQNIVCNSENETGLRLLMFTLILHLTYPQFSPDPFRSSNPPRP